MDKARVQVNDECLEMICRRVVRLLQTRERVTLKFGTANDAYVFVEVPSYSCKVYRNKIAPRYFEFRSEGEPDVKILQRSVRGRTGGRINYSRAYCSNLVVLERYRKNS